MILKEKGIPDSTMLSLVAKLLRRDTTTKGFKVKGVDGVQPVTYDEVVQFVETLSQQVKEGQYREVNHCDTCRYFSGTPMGSRGACFPDNFTSSRVKKDFCSGWTPMTPEQEQTRRKINALLQTK